LCGLYARLDLDPGFDRRWQSVARKLDRRPLMNQNRRSASAFFRPMELTYDTWVAFMFVLLVIVIAATFLFGLRRDE
jgi:hypothetical protein